MAHVTRTAVLLLAVLGMVSCATVGQTLGDIERGKALRRTSNPQATAGCRLVARLYNGDAEAGEFARRWPNADYLVYEPARAYPELYDCTPQASGTPQGQSASPKGFRDFYQQVSPVPTPTPTMEPYTPPYNTDDGKTVPAPQVTKTPTP